MLRKLFRRTPLAWLQLKKEKTRLAIALAGIAFADMLMFVQLGLLDALLDSASKPHQNLQADLVVINSQFQTFYSVKGFPRERLQQILAYQGVKSVHPLYLNTARWRNPQTSINRDILVWGIDPINPAFDFPEVKGNLDKLKQLNKVIFDSASRPEYGPIPDLIEQKGTVETLVNDQTIQAVGIFKMGASFAADGNIIVSDSTFLKLFSSSNADTLALGLIRLNPDANLEKIQLQIKANLAKDVRVLTLEEFAQIEKDYWLSQGTGYIFGIGVVVGFIVGIVIVYQILYSDVSEHLSEYATLKAMGYSDGYLMVMLMQEALIMSVLGFLPGILLSMGLYQITFAATLLPITMKIDRAIFVLVLTIIMCSFSGVVSMRKLQSADPADVF